MDLSKDNLFRELLEELVKDSFSQARDFRSKTLQTICSEMELQNCPTSKESSDEPGFERVNSLICLILNHLELNGSTDFPPDSLSTHLEKPIEGLSLRCPFESTARHLRQLKSATVLSQGVMSQIEKMIGLNICLSIETNLAQALLNPLQQFWPNKNKVIRESVVLQNQKPVLSEHWKRSIEPLLSHDTNGLTVKYYEKGFLDCFRSLASLSKPDSVETTLSQSAILVLLLSSQGDLNLSQTDTATLSSLLFCMDERKKSACSIDLILSGSWLSDLEEDRSLILSLIGRIRASGSFDKVAA